MSIKVLQVASEVTPIVKSGGLADVVSALPQALHKLGHDCRIIIPKYSFINSSSLNAVEIDQFSFKSKAGQDVQVLVYQAKVPEIGVVLYLVETSIGLSSPVLYPTELDGEQFRFIVFGLAVSNWLNRSGWQPDLIHAHDWMAAPLLSQIAKRSLRRYPTLLTIHNAKYQGEINAKNLGQFSPDVPISGDKVNLLKEGLKVATKINTVSPTYAKEIHTAEYGYGIEELIRQRSEDVSGIVNGLDIERFSTNSNPLVQPSFNLDNASKIRPVHKQNLMDKLGLSDRSKPLFAVVGRTGSQKGMDVLAEVLDHSQILDKINLIILVGRGTKRIEDLLEHTAQNHPSSLKLLLGFDDLFSHQIYAGADFIIMPSRYEPCGLSQLIGMRYGAIPVVRRTGGLLDTVADISQANGQGITYDNHTAASLLHALERAVGLYADPALINQIAIRNMQRDFSWDKPASQYIQIYQSMIETDKQK